MDLTLPTKRMLTADEAAAYCGLSVNSFRSYVPIAPVNFGRSVRYDQKALDEWLDSFRQSQASHKPVWERAGNAGEGRGR